jgi:hypothetical protein
MIRADGLVKNPSAALRFNPALLDKRLRILVIGEKILSPKSEYRNGIYLTG